MFTLTSELLGHVPVVVYVTVYVFGELVETSITPVLVLILKPAGEAEKLPPARPVIVGTGSESFTQ